MRLLLRITAILELGAGLGLLTIPSIVASLMLGAPLDAPAALTVARIGGAALLALAIACWLASYDAQSCAARGLVSAMVIYNIGAALVLGMAGIRSQSAGVALWAAVILHSGMTLYCMTQLLKKELRKLN